MKPAFYIAAPFFNPVQLQLVKDIELVLGHSGIEFFSPRLQAENEKRGPLSPEDAATIFRRNVDGIQAATHMLAVVDWKMPENQTVAVVTWTPALDKDISVSKYLNIPDSGVVWELGFAQALNLQALRGYGRPGPRIILYTERPKEAPLNLMLTQRTAGVIRSLQGLQCYLNLGNPDSKYLEQWEGRNI